MSATTTTTRTAPGRDRSGRHLLAPGVTRATYAGGDNPITRARLAPCEPLAPWWSLSREQRHAALMLAYVLRGVGTVRATTTTRERVTTTCHERAGMLAWDTVRLARRKRLAVARAEWRENLARRAARPGARTGGSRRTLTARVTAPALSRRHTRSHGVTLTLATRHGLRLMCDTVTRERLAERDALTVRAQDGRASRWLARESAADVAARLNRTARQDNEGMVSAREPRYAERGRGTLASASAARATTRDAHTVPALLRHMRTVGVATHPLASREQRAWLMCAVLTDVRLATVTVLRPGPHGLMRTVRDAESYASVARERRTASRTASATTRADTARALMLAVGVSASDARATADGTA